MISADQDAAFFEDWSDWASLDDQPARPITPNGELIRWGAIGLRCYSRYYCDLRLNIGRIGGPAFEIALPPSAHIHRMLRLVPGAHQDPRATDYSRPAHQRLRNTWYVPAEHWRALRAALPAIKAATKTWVAANRRAKA